MRKIIVDGIEFQWKVGSSHVLIENRELKIKLHPTLVEATNNQNNWNDFEKRIASITPVMIKNYIQQHVPKQNV